MPALKSLAVAGRRSLSALVQGGALPLRGAGPVGAPTLSTAAAAAPASARPPPAPPPAAAAATHAAADVSYTVGADGIATIVLDAQGEKMNTLNARLMGQFDALLTKLAADPAVKAAVLISAKSDNFIAGTRRRAARRGSRVRGQRFARAAAAERGAGGLRSLGGCTHRRRARAASVTRARRGRSARPRGFGWISF
jgi:hypothetical protein